VRRRPTAHVGWAHGALTFWAFAAAIACADPTHFLREQFLTHAKARYGQAIATFQLLREYSDMRLPHEWYPKARQIKVRRQGECGV